MSLSNSPVLPEIALVAWTPIPSTLNPTIGSGTAIGDFGVLGVMWSSLYAFVPVQGPGGTAANFPVPVASVLAGGTTGVAYSETITAQGGTSPYTYDSTLAAPGLTMSSAGVISGMPTTAGTYTFTVTVTDANGYTGSQSFSITIAAPASGGGASNFGMSS